MTNYYELYENILKPNEKPKVSRGGYHIGRCYGQTHVRIPPREVIGLYAETIYKIGKKIYPKQRVGLVHYCKDCIAFDLPLCTENEIHYEQEKHKKLFAEDPSKIFPEYYKPDEFILALYEISNLALVRKG